MTVIRQLLRASLGAAALGVALGAAAQERDRDWAEAQATPPARVALDKLLEFTVSVRSELRYGLDPDSVSIGSDGVVRYVLVASSASGTRNVIYEGMRCATAEVRAYARWTPEDGWRALQGSEWKSWRGNSVGQAAERLARDGFCNGRYPNEPVARMLNELRLGKPTLR